MTQSAGRGFGRRGWGAWRGAGCRDRPRLGRCASVSLHICGRMNHPTDVGSQGRAVTPATQRCAGGGDAVGTRGPSRGQKEPLASTTMGAGLTFDTQAMHKPTLTSCTYCHFRWDPKMILLFPNWGGGHCTKVTRT